MQVQFFFELYTVHYEEEKYSFSLHQNKIIDGWLVYHITLFSNTSSTAIIVSFVSWCKSLSRRFPKPENQIKQAKHKWIFAINFYHDDFCFIQYLMIFLSQILILLWGT